MLKVIMLKAVINILLYTLLDLVSTDMVTEEITQTVAENITTQYAGTSSWRSQETTTTEPIVNGISKGIY